ncbi:MAG TPA: hypothetical protein VFG76_06880 [Candidatus Polarisedimenticolia bacterium]|nr:hypothetical protein [Candidatus Polarisedimenticolia bacterium]
MDIGSLKAAGFRGLEGLADDVFQRCLEAATVEIERQIAPRRLVAANYIEDYDGALAAGRWKDTLYLDQWPVISVTSVTESGTALVTGTGYDAGGTIAVLREDARGVLRRRPGGSDLNVLSSSSPFRRWSAGYQNIRVTYRAGYEETAIPSDLIQACIELTVLLIKQASRSGSEAVSRGRGSVTYATELPDRTKRIIDRYAPWGRPRCRLAAAA